MQMQQTGGRFISQQSGNSRKEGAREGWRERAREGGVEIAEAEVIHHFIQKHLLEGHRA